MKRIIYMTWKKHPGPCCDWRGLRQLKLFL
jgi:hypothetical protein